MPEVGNKLKQGDVMDKLKSLKILDNIYCLSVTVTEVNKNTLEAPDLSTKILTIRAGYWN